METRTRTVARMDGPLPRTPQRVTAGMLLRGRRVAVWDNPSGEWRDDVRAASDPYWRSEDGTVRWRNADGPPEGIDTTYAELIVAVAQERDWYEAMILRTGRPTFKEYPAHMVWLI